MNAYGRSKLAGEAVVRSTARTPWIILRPSAIYGPGDRGFLPLARMAQRGLSLRAASGGMPFTFVYVDDAVDAVARATKSDVSGTALFVGHPAPESTDAMLRGLAEQAGRTYRPISIPGPIVRLAGLAGDAIWAFGGRPLLDSSRVSEFMAPGFVCDVSRARERLGFSAAVGLSEGLARTVRWYRDRGWV